MDQIDLSICTECKREPAVYGDGLTFALCSACNQKKNGKNEPEIQSPVEEKFEHKIVPGLVSIVLPVFMTNYTLFHYTGNCIGSVREHTHEGAYEIVIVDNGSPVQPPSLNSYYAQRVIKNEKNLGVTKAWNQGIRTSVGEYIVLLSNDVLVFDHWLEGLIDPIKNGIYDLTIAHPMYSLNEPFARSYEAQQVWDGTKKFDPLDKDFSCVMFKRSLIDEIGPFDEQFFSYCSDTDFFKRMEEKGKKYKVIDRVATSHISSATGFSLPETPEIMNQDKEKFDKKYKPQVKIKEGHLVRTPLTGDAIYFLSGVDDKYHHIKDPDTLHALGFEFGMEKLVDKLSDHQVGEQINMDNYKKYV